MSKAPIDGTILLKYAEQGEMTGIGKALFKIADVENMILKAYVTADQLAALKLGQQVRFWQNLGKQKTGNTREKSPGSQANQNSPQKPFKPRMNVPIWFMRLRLLLKMTIF